MDRGYQRLIAPLLLAALIPASAWAKGDPQGAANRAAECYVTDRWTKNKVHIVDFDNVVVAREYIGPSSAKKR